MLSDRAMRRPLVAFALVALAAGCGPSAKDIKAAKDAAYQTDFAVVWNAVAAAVREEYKQIEIEDAVQGKILTRWDLVTTLGSDDSRQNEQATVGTVQTGDFREGTLFRLKVNIVGGPPWRVIVDGEAAHYTPGLAMLQPYRQGVADEQPWVYTRIDKMYVKIHERLKDFAIVAPVRAQADLDEAHESADTSLWANLPAGAGQVVSQVHDAAKARDAKALRAHMPETFSSPTAEDAPSDNVVTVWTADPTELSVLQAVLAGGCVYDQTQELVTCPKEAGEFRASFRKVGDTWRFVAFERM